MIEDQWGYVIKGAWADWAYAHPEREEIAKRAVDRIEFGMSTDPILNSFIWAEGKWLRAATLLGMEHDFDWESYMADNGYVP